MSGADIRRALWERTGPMFAGLAWSVPAAMWTAMAVGDLPSYTSGIEMSLAVPAAVCLVVMLVLERRLTWPGRLVATVLGVSPVAALVTGTLPGVPFVLALLEVVTALAWGAMIVSLAIGHIAPARALSDKPVGVRLAPLSIWLVVTSLWVIIQASPTSSIAADGTVLEIQMGTIAGLTGLSVMIVSAVCDRIPALRRPTTAKGRLR